jgi:TldD protein
MKMKRREFLSRAAAGGAILTMPAFLQGCGTQLASIMSEPPPENPFLTSFGVDESTVTQVMSALTSNGADIADAYFQHTRSNKLTFTDRAVGNVGSAVEQGVGLRVVKGDHTGFAFTEDLSLQSMLATAESAAVIAGGTTVTNAPALQFSPTGDLYVVAVPWGDVGVDRKTAILQSIDDKVRAADPAIEEVTMNWDDVDERVMIATLDGSVATDNRPMTRLTLVVTATRDGATQTGFSSIAARAGIDWYTEERITDLVDEAVSRTLVQFDARRAPSGEMPVILAAGASGVVLHEAVGHALEADFVMDGSSPYQDKIGTPIADAEVTLVDDARLPGERGALNFDDEGTLTGRTTLVENGVLNSLLHDKASAQHFSVDPTGSGRRESFRHAPMPRMTCTSMRDGPHSRDDIIAAVESGIVCETYSDGQVDLGGGDFTFQVKNGWLVEKGRVTAPIKDVSISGNGPELLSRITMVGNDSQLDAGGWSCGKKGQVVPVSQGMPTVLVSELLVT